MNLYCTNCQTVTQHDVDVSTAYCGVCGNPTDLTTLAALNLKFTDPYDEEDSGRQSRDD